MPEQESVAAGQGYTVPCIINGKERQTDKVFEVVSPATGKVIHHCAAVSVADADAAVEAAAAAFKSWKRTTPPERRDIFLKAAQIMESRSQELIQSMADETGGPIPWCEFNIFLAKGLILDIAGRIPTLEGSVPATSRRDVSSIILSEPYGVVLAMAPWNAPYILGTRAMATPLAAGNTVVFKVTERAPKTMWQIYSVFKEAGLPDGVVNMICHDPADAATVTEALIANPLVRKINFTGSTGVGRIIGKLAGTHLKPVVLELGGKAPAIIWEDADLDLAAAQCAFGSYDHGGQVCMSTEKILVHKAVKEKFCEKFALAIEKFTPSSEPAAILINAAAVDKTKALVKDAVSKGASILFGELDAQDISTTRMRPILLEKVTKDMDIYTIETFGPTVVLYEIETEEEAIEMANDTEYGLNAAVFTEDLRRGLRIAKEIEAGSVHINGATIHDESGLPHGGTKASGFGRFNASHGLQEWVKSKTLTFRD